MSSTAAARTSGNRPASWWRSLIHRRLPRLLPGGRDERLPQTLHRHRIYILPTGYGLFFGALVFVMLLGSLNYNNNLALMLTFLLGGMLLIVPVHTYRNLAGLRAVSCRAAPVFAGRKVRFRLLLSNPGSRPRAAIRAWNGDDEDRVNLEAEGEGLLALTRETHRRGYLGAGRVRLFTEFPMGLFHAWTWLDEPGRTIVYPLPARAGVPLPPASGGDRRGLTREEDDEEFAGIRDYRPGDPARLIAWKALARTDTLKSKVFQSPAGSTLWLDFTMAHGDTETRLSMLTRWVLDAETRGLRYGLRLPGVTIPPGRLGEHRDQCLRALALFGTT